jgi:hypothetical protein
MITSTVVAKIIPRFTMHLDRVVFFFWALRKRWDKPDLLLPSIKTPGLLEEACHRSFIGRSAANAPDWNTPVPESIRIGEAWNSTRRKKPTGYAWQVCSH